MRRALVVAAAVASLVFGITGVAEAMRDPFPTCIRECSPLPELPGGPCEGALEGFC